MKEIKRLFDPNNIMNPGKVIDGWYEWRMLYLYKKD